MIAVARRHVLSAALRVAAEQYDHDADITISTMSDDQAVGRDRLVNAFRAQAAETRQLANAIEEADQIKLTD